MIDQLNDYTQKLKKDQKKLIEENDEKIKDIESITKNVMSLEE